MLVFSVYLLQLTYPLFMKREFDDKLGYFTFHGTCTYNKLFNGIISARGSGKTTSMEWKTYRSSEKGLNSVYLVRNVTGINENEINSMFNRINEFLSEENQITGYVNKSELNNAGVATVYYYKKNLGFKEGYKNKKIFCTYMALNKNLQALKKTYIPNMKDIYFDEYNVCTPKGDKYLKNEWLIITEIVNTLKRSEYKPNGLKVWFMGNPYSKYSPFVAAFDIDTKLIKRGCFLYGKNWTFQCYDLPQQLKDKLKESSLYDEKDNEYNKYAFDGEFSFEEKIEITNRVSYYKLQYFIYHNETLISINKNERDTKHPFYIKKTSFDEVHKNNKKPIYVFEPCNLSSNRMLLLSKYSKETEFIKYSILSYFKIFALRYNKLECYYVIQDLLNYV